MKAKSEADSWYLYLLINQIQQLSAGGSVPLNQWSVRICHWGDANLRVLKPPGNYKNQMGENWEFYSILQTKPSSREAEPGCHCCLGQEWSAWIPLAVPHLKNEVQWSSVAALWEGEASVTLLPESSALPKAFWSSYQSFEGLWMCLTGLSRDISTQNYTFK